MVLELQNTTVTGGDSEPKESLPDEHGQPFALCRTPPGLQTPTGHRHHHSSILQHSLPDSLVLGGHLREIFSLAERLSAPQSSSSVNACLDSAREVASHWTGHYVSNRNASTFFHPPPAGSGTAQPHWGGTLLPAGSPTYISR